VDNKALSQRERVGGACEMVEGEDLSRIISVLGLELDDVGCS
jgi:tellurite resistance protein